VPVRLGRCWHALITVWMTGKGRDRAECTISAVTSETLPRVVAGTALAPLPRCERHFFIQPLIARC
jgi:hypothetical protein